MIEDLKLGLVPEPVVEHIRALLAHIHKTAEIANDTTASAVGLDPNRFAVLRRELEIAQGHRDELVVLVQVAWCEAIGQDT